MRHNFAISSFRWSISALPVTMARLLRVGGILQAFNPSGALARLRIQGLNLIGKGIAVMAAGCFDDGAICTGRKDSCAAKMWSFTRVRFGRTLRAHREAHTTAFQISGNHTLHNPCSSATATLARIRPRRG